MLPTFDSIGNRRSACDRCRRHKLRCERGDVSGCRRCEKANAHCVTGPALQSGRPMHPESSLEQNSQYIERASVADAPVSPANLDTTSEIVAYEARSNMPQLISPCNIYEFNDIWSSQFDQGMVMNNNGPATFSPLREPRNESLRKLSKLQANILADLDTVRSCRTAEKCSEAVSPDSSSTGHNVMVGHMLDHSTTLIDILDCFQPISAEKKLPELSCDMPTLCILMSCYVSLTRIYRSILSCILDSMPFLLAIQHSTPQLFPGIHLGGFQLEARVDLQVQILVNISKDMLESIESRFALGDDRSRDGRQARILRNLLDEEALEQPPFLERREDCAPLKDILNSLKAASRGRDAQT